MNLAAYPHIVAARFRALLQYRGAALGGLATQAFFGVTRIMILEAFYRSTTAAQPMTFAEAVGYIWLGQALLILMPWNVDPDIREQIRDGSVVYELCRPLDLYGLWFCRAVAARTAPVLMRLVPMAVLAVVILPLVGLEAWAWRAPPSAAAAAWFAATIVGALLLSCGLTTLMNITLIWTIQSQGGVILLGGLTMVLGGLVIPVPLFPEWAQPVLTAMPFCGILDLPSRVYVGQIPAAQAPWVIVHQLFWAAVLVGLGRWLLGRGTRRMVVHGG
jgi:ABC-2 type transport system permease protein